jgi:hypothetical protein
MYVGFEIEVETESSNIRHDKDALYDLIEAVYPITGWSRRQGISGYHRHESRTEQGLWRVETDASLVNGAEFVMPPVNKDTAFSLLEKLFELIDESKCTTSKRCGLHLNISDNTRTLNRVNIGYFITNVNYRLLAALWPDRVKSYSTYCVGFKHVLMNMLNNGAANLESDKKEQETFQKSLLSNHNSMINVRLDRARVLEERFEIRTMGGKDYHKKLREIKITTNMFEEMLERSYGVCKRTYTNKKIISYINRVNNRQKTRNYIWIPTRHTLLAESGQKKLTANLYSIRNIHEHGAWELLDSFKIRYRAPHYKAHRYKSFDSYCAGMLETVNRRVFSNTDMWGQETAKTRNALIIRLTNEAIYHIVKYMSNNPTVYPPFLCNKIIKKYMTGRTRIGDTKMALTIPENEKQRDIVWLSRHMYIFNNETRQRYINMLSKHMLVFINKHKEKYGKGILRMSQKKIKELSN